MVRSSGKVRWVPVGQVKVLSSGWEQLTEPLAAEGAPLPDPPLKGSIVRGFEAAGVSVHFVKAARVREVLRRAEPLSVPLKQVPRANLRKREWVESLLRFCLSDEPGDISGLPLAVTSNGLLRTFGVRPSGEPLFLAATDERAIFASKPEWFLDEEFAAASNLDAAPLKGIGRMGPAEVVEWLPKLLPPGAGLRLVDTESGTEPASVGWLVLVYRYVTVAVRKGFRPNQQDLQKIAMVPDQRGLLRCPGYANTPLLSKDFTGEPLRAALESFGVPLITAPPELWEAIASFSASCKCGFVWKLTGPDLADTLATLSSAALPPFDRTTYAPVLDYLALPRWRAATAGYTPEQQGKLRTLPIFPTTSGELVALDGDALLPGDFVPPSSGTALALLDLGEEGRWRPFLTFLAVSSLGRADFIEEHLLPGYDSLTPPGQLRALRWLQDNLNRALSEREEQGGDAEALFDAVRGASLIRCEDGTNSPAAEVYDPAAPLVRELFGAAAAFPDQAFYAKGLDRWLSFFRTVGMVDCPRAQDLLRHIDRLTAEAERVGVERVTARLVRVFQHLDARWAELRDEPVQDFDGNTLAAAVRARAWRPAERTRTRLRRWPGSVLPEARLHRADELYLQDQANLVASQAPVLSISRVGAAIREDLAFPASPPLKVVLDHFERLLGLWEGNVGRPAAKAFEAALTEVYRYLARFDGKGEADTIRERFADRPCLWHDGSLWTPRHVFRARVPYFGIRRATVTVKGQVRQAYQLLGLRERPELGDLLEHLEELLGEHGDHLLPAAEVTRLLTLYHRLVQEPGYDDPDGTRFPLLTGGGRLVEAEDAFFNDAPWFADRIDAEAVRLLHKDLPVEIRQLPWVRSLAKEVTERPLGSWRPADDERALQRAATLGKVVRSEEFRRGLARLLNHVHGVCRPGGLYWLAKASVAAVAEIRSELVVCLGGRELILRYRPR